VQSSSIPAPVVVVPPAVKEEKKPIAPVPAPESSGGGKTRTPAILSAIALILLAAAAGFGSWRYWLAGPAPREPDVASTMPPAPAPAVTPAPVEVKPEPPAPAPATSKVEPPVPAPIPVEPPPARVDKPAPKPERSDLASGDAAAKMVAEGRSAYGRKEYKSAISYANSALLLDSGNAAAKKLLKDAQAARDQAMKGISVN